MYGREELEECGFSMRWWYRANDADKVMDTMETRIKELESTLYTDNTAIIKALQNRIKELESQLPKWISVKDRLPEELKPVYVNVRGESRPYIAWFNYETWISREVFFLDGLVTHWMPLPPPPITEEK